jgi:hypothetical protein
MPETIDDLLKRLRKQDYQIVLTAEGKISAKPAAGILPDHVRAILTARREEIVAHLRAETFQQAHQAFRAAVYRMVAEYEARKPLTRCWAEGRALVDIWWGVMPQKAAYDAQDTAAVLAAATQLDVAVAACFRRWDAAVASLSASTPSRYNRGACTARSGQMQVRYER